MPVRRPTKHEEIIVPELASSVTAVVVGVLTCCFSSCLLPSTSLSSSPWTRDSECPLSGRAQGGLSPIPLHLCTTNEVLKDCEDLLRKEAETSGSGSN